MSTRDPWTKTVRNGPALKMLKLRTGLNQEQTNFENCGLYQTRVKTISKLLDRTRTNLKIWRSMKPCFSQLLRCLGQTQRDRDVVIVFSKSRLLTPSRISRTDHAVLSEETNKNTGLYFSNLFDIR